MWALLTLVLRFYWLNFAGWMVGGLFCKPEPSSTTAHNREICKKFKHQNILNYLGCPKKSNQVTNSHILFFSFSNQNGFMEKYWEAGVIQYHKNWSKSSPKTLIMFNEMLFFALAYPKYLEYLFTPHVCSLCEYIIFIRNSLESNGIFWNTILFFFVGVGNHFE